MKPMVRREDTAEEVYLIGLNLYVDGQRDEALRLLVECARLNSEKVDAFYHAGNIFREMGKVDKAERIHQELLMRPSLTGDKRKRVQLALVRDYIALKKYQQAESLLKEAAGGTKNKLILEELLKIYEVTEEWEKALDTLSELEKVKDQPDPRYELYCLESGKALMKTDGHAARLRFKEAIKRNSNSPWPYILIADSYFQAERVDDALEYWSKFFDKMPKHAHLLFSRIEKFYFEGGAYHEVGRIYRELLENEPNNIDAMLALAAYMARMGERDEAMVLCRKVIEISPDSREAQAELLHQMVDGGSSFEEIKEVVKDVLQLVPAKKRFRCKSCGERTENPSWKCSACGAWNPYEV
ncbi:MAG: tetratricopeptide repeat protein [Fibrobacteres bacterium]|nr:tetratricopeptide repeat protein [Fibrobacterota bacterium]